MKADKPTKHQRNGEVKCNNQGLVMKATLAI